jgi:hypothetical protein
VTLVHITKEKEPERASTLGPDAPIQILLKRDHEVESDLDTELLNFPGTPMDNSRDEMGSGGQKQEVPQQEIDTSTVDYKVSTEPIPDSLISVEASLDDEKQMEEEPSRHI